MPDQDNFFCPYLRWKHLIAMHRKHLSFIFVAYGGKATKRSEKLRVQIMTNLLNLAVSSEFRPLRVSQLLYFAFS